MELSWSHTSHQGVGCFTNDVVGCTGCCIDRMCLESWGRDIPSVKKAEMRIPLQKSNLASNNDHLASLRFSFLADMKYSRFLWSVQISNWCSTPFRKCLHSSKAQMMANISLLCIS